MGFIIKCGEMVLAETWGDIRQDYNRAADTSFGGLFSGLLSYASKDHIGESIPHGAADLAWRTPKAAVMSVVQPVRKDIFKIAEVTAESLGTFKIEILKDLMKPIAFTMGHIRHRIFKDLDITSPSSILKSAWGVVTLPFALGAGVGSAIVHLPADLLSFGPTVVGGVAKTIGGVGEKFFGAFHTFGKGMLVTADTFERGVNRMIVPPRWREDAEREYENITRWGEEFAIA